MAKKPLHDLLCEVLDPHDLNASGGRCYFEPPASIQLHYPCIVYNYSNDLDRFADNARYKHDKRYTVTIIDSDPDSVIPDRMRELRYCSFDRHYSADGLSHFVFTLYYNGPRIRGGDIDEGNDQPTDEREI